jgi:transcriptional regulator with XRE-family HTH domain
MGHLKALRQSLGLKQKDAALRIGCTAAELSRLESGKVDPKLSTLQKVADGLGVTLSQLFDPWHVTKRSSTKDAS